MRLALPVTQRGVGLAYLLAFIALLSIVTMSLSQMTRGATRSRLNFDTSMALHEQAQLIRNRILVCAVAYPVGDNGTGFHPTYPATPGSGLLRDAVCPGQPAPGNLWSGTGGLLLPPPPRGFAPWTLSNDAASLRIALAALDPADAGARGIIDHLLARLGSGASRSAGVLTIVLMY
jgi:hypothetical protein